MIFFSIEVLPVGLVQTILNLAPFMTLIISYMCLKETLKGLEIVNMIVSFIGVLFMVYFSENAPNVTK
jgi:drug/metabolite transporter (DMT)-like permease